MRALVVVVLVASACKFEPGTLGGSPTDDASPQSDAPVVIDAPPDVSPDARMCLAAPSGCTLFTCEGSSSCYYACGTATTGKVNYNAAVSLCTSQNLGCIVTINDVNENNCIASETLPVFPNAMIWLGYEQATNGQEPDEGWSWECGTSGFLAGNWGDPTGEPNDTNNDEDCATIITNNT